MRHDGWGGVLKAVSLDKGEMSILKKKKKKKKN